MSDEGLSAIRQKLLDACLQNSDLEELGIHSVTFSVRSDRANEDRVVTQLWEFDEEAWMFLAVCDGHIGQATVDYTARRLPPYIRSGITKLDKRIPDFQDKVSKTLKSYIKEFDKHIGRNIKDLVPKSGSLDEEAARKLIAENSEIVDRAYCGTTLAIALVNLSTKMMWVANVGDSTVGMSSVNAQGERTYQALSEAHNLKNPREYFRTSLPHSSEEDRAFEGDRVLGQLSVTRAIGDFPFKLSRSYTDNLFSYLPYASEFTTVMQELNISPPYVDSEPFVSFIDLNSLWNMEGCLICLFTDGVDSLVSGRFNFRQDNPSTAEPGEVLAALLDGRDSDDYVSRTLGHKVEFGWNTEHGGNRATEVLGNLLGGRDLRRLNMVFDPALLAVEPDEFYIDDTSIVVWDVWKVSQALLEAT